MPPRRSARLAPAAVPASPPHREASPAADDEDDRDLDEIIDSELEEPFVRIIEAYVNDNGEVRTSTKPKKRSLTLSLGNVSLHIEGRPRTRELRPTLGA
jgi:hypothetical protein